MNSMTYSSRNLFVILILCVRILYPLDMPTIRKCLSADNDFYDAPTIWATRFPVRHADKNTTRSTFYLLASTGGESVRFLFRSHHPCVYANNNGLWSSICILETTELSSYKQNTLELSWKIKAFGMLLCVGWSIFTDVTGESNGSFFGVQTVKGNSFQWSRISARGTFCGIFLGFFHIFLSGNSNL